MPMSALAAGPLTSLAFCWQLERRDGAGVALTSHDRPIHRDSLSFAPAPGMAPAAVVREGGLDGAMGEIEGMISSSALTDEDLELGRWDGARIELTAVDWSGESAETVVLLTGEIGTVTISDGSFAAEMSGPAAALDAPICPDTSPECRARLGDRQCRVDLSARRRDGTTQALDGNRLTLSPPPTEALVGGEVQVVSGPMSGFRSAILAVDGDALILRDPPRAEIRSGDRVWLVEGCDKRFQTCRERFANSANFRGEPHLPGNDLLTRYPGA